MKDSNHTEEAEFAWDDIPVPVRPEDLAPFAFSDCKEAESEDELGQ